MVRVEFRLRMPGRPATSQWGEGRNYVIVKDMTDKAAASLFRGPLLTPTHTHTWTHRWDDGWMAQITARIVPKGERRAKSDGFAGYDWMVANILRYGATEKPKEGNV